MKTLVTFYLIIKLVLCYERYDENVIITRPPTRPPNTPRPTIYNRPATRPPDNYQFVTPLITRPPTRPPIRPPTRPPGGTMTPTNIMVYSEKDKEENCGVTDNNAVPYLLNAESTYRGEWPWHVAIYMTERRGLEYKCGGTIISKRAIITAAHCIINLDNGRLLDIQKIVIYVGKHNLLYGWSEDEGVQTFHPQRLVKHPNFNLTGLTADIGLIILDSDIKYTAYARKICMWPTLDIDIRSLEGKLGTVVGWGYDNSLSPSNVLQKVQIPVKSFQQCLSSDRDFFSTYLVDKTFCAGYRNGTTACNGDSGGGMVFHRDRRWFLRGIVSNGKRGDPTEEGSASLICSKNSYTIFVDVPQYYDWITDNVPDLKNNL